MEGRTQGFWGFRGSRRPCLLHSKHQREEGRKRECGCCGPSVEELEKLSRGWEAVEEGGGKNRRSEERKGMEEASAGGASGGDGGGGGEVSADSYIGSFISLTSKYEIRYEGILYNINTEESSIGLRNVRSFGTEGRKKDGPQIPPSDKIYEYILFRGSDIKDLQVKSSPPVQALPIVHNDPAIIQSHYSQPVSITTSMSSGVGGSIMDFSSQGAYLTRSAFQGALPLYQPGGSIGTWDLSTSVPNVNGSGLDVYWQGLCGPSNGLPQGQQFPMPFQPPGMAIPQAMQQNLLYPGVHAPVGTSTVTPPEFSNLHPAVSSVVSASVSLPSALTPSEAMPLTSGTSPSLDLNRTSLTSISPADANTTLQLTASLSSFTQEINAIVTPSPTRLKLDPTPTLTYQSPSQLMRPIVGASTSVHSETSVLSLITPDQLLQPGPSSLAEHSVQTGQKNVEEVDSSTSLTESPSLVSLSTDVKGSLLPLPRSSDQKAGRSATQFTEEFDFMAMNEKFKKDEVWGHLGKTRAQLRNKNIDLEEGNYDVVGEKDDARHPTFEMKPVYVKDDFFDSLSCNSLDRGSRSGRADFSERIRLDAETFGDLPRHRGGHGGRGARRGNFRGSYYGGRRYGYGGRGPGLIPTRGQ